MPRKPVTTNAVERELSTEELPDGPFERFLDHQRRAFVEASKAFSSLLPKELREHGQNAVKEMVEGYRALFNTTLDDLIKTLEKARLEENEGEKHRVEE